MGRPVTNKHRIGEINVNNFGSIIKISNYRSSDDIDVYFPEYDWTNKRATYQSFTKGQVKCPYEPRIYNVGYIGEGVRDVNDIKTRRCYNTWLHMLERCYSDRYHEEKPSYINCEVCNEWHNFQNFHKWYFENIYEIEGEVIHLDKDIICKGNKIYSPETCIFVPQYINSLLINSTSARGNLPVGVKYDERCGKYQARSNNGKNKKVSLGYYSTVQEAFNAYKIYKENHIKDTADLYKNKIPKKLYDALYSYVIEIDD